MCRREATDDARPKATRVLRSWRGSTRAEDARSYVEYLSRTGYESLRATPGNLGVLGLLQIDGNRAEHVVMSLWESEQAIRSFAGEDVGRAVFYPEDDDYLVDKDERCRHFEVVFVEGWSLAGSPPGRGCPPAAAPRRNRGW